MSHVQAHLPKSIAWCALVVVVIVMGSGCEPADPLEEIRLLQDVNSDYAGSVEPLRELVEERPDDPEVSFRYGLALVATGQVSLARWPLRKAMESPEWLEPAGLQLTAAALALGAWDEAMATCDRVLEADPDNVAALLLRADAAVRSRRHYDRALADAERVLELDPDNTGALAPKIVALLALERIEEAEEAMDLFESAHVDEGLGLHGSPILCAAQATFLAERDEPDRAAERFSSCLAHFPADPVVVEEAISFFNAQDRGDRAEEVLVAALEAAPDSFAYRNALFVRLRATDREEEAEQLLRDATLLPSPQSAAEAWAALALYFIEQEKFDEAADAFARARELDASRNPDVLFGYADALAVAGRYDEALRVGKTIGVPAHRRLVQARVELERGRPSAAMPHFEEANRLWPDNAVARYYTARAAEQLGDFKRAFEDYRYSMRIDVRATDAYLRLARMQAAAGANDSALTALGFQAGDRPSEEEAQILWLELLAREGQNPPPQLLRGLANSPRRGAAAAALAKGFAARRGPERAVEFILGQESLDLTDPRDADALEVLLDALVALEKPAEALARVDAGLEKHPEAAVFHALRGRVLARRAEPDPEAARASLVRALEIEAEQPRALFELARLEEAAGDRESAFAHFDRAARADESHRLAASEAARLLGELDRGEEAEARLEEILVKHPYDARAAMLLAELRIARDAEIAPTRALARRAIFFGGGAPAQELFDRLEAEGADESKPEQTG